MCADARTYPNASHRAPTHLSLAVLDLLPEVGHELVQVRDSSFEGGGILHGVQHRRRLGIILLGCGDARRVARQTMDGARSWAIVLEACGMSHLRRPPPREVPSPQRPPWCAFTPRPSPRAVRTVAQYCANPRTDERAQLLELLTPRTKYPQDPCLEVDPTGEKHTSTRLPEGNGVSLRVESSRRRALALDRRARWCATR